MKTDKKFPNGFNSWSETHYEVVSFLTQTASDSGSISNTTREQQGIGGLYLLAEQLTDEFEQLNEGRQWDGEFHDEIAVFLKRANLVLYYTNK